jgi:predicted esterase
LAENESVRKNAESLYQYYLKRGANVYWHTYKGEHALYFSEILPIMQSLSGSEL